MLCSQRACSLRSTTRTPACPSRTWTAPDRSISLSSMLNIQIVSWPALRLTRLNRSLVLQNLVTMESVVTSLSHKSHHSTRQFLTWSSMDCTMLPAASTFTSGPSPPGTTWRTFPAPGLAATSTPSTWTSPPVPRPTRGPWTSTRWATCQASSETSPAGSKWLAPLWTPPFVCLGPRV